MKIESQTNIKSLFVAILTISAIGCSSSDNTVPASTSQKKSPAASSEIQGTIDGKNFKQGSTIAKLEGEEITLFIADQKNPTNFACENGSVVNEYKDEQAAMNEYDGLNIRLRAKKSRQNIGTEAEASFFSASIVGKNQGGISFPASSGKVDVTNITSSYVEGSFNVQGPKSTVGGRFKIRVCTANTGSMNSASENLTQSQQVASGLQGVVSGKEFKAEAAMAKMENGEITLFIADHRDPVRFGCDAGSVVDQYASEADSMAEYDGLTVWMRVESPVQYIGDDASASFHSANVVGSNEGAMAFPADSGAVVINEISPSYISGTMSLQSSEAAISGEFHIPLCQSY